MKKTYIFITIGVLILAGGIFAFKKSGSTPPPVGDNSKKEFTITEKDNIKGKMDAPVTIVEFSDFQCPYCSLFQPTAEKILLEFPDKVRLVYKHFPLDAIHKQARPAAEAAECAAEQGMFWEYSQGLFGNQVGLGEAFYKELTAQLGFNEEQFEQCVSSRKYKDKVEQDLQAGIKAGVQGTPTSFINGKQLRGAVSYEELKTSVLEALNENQ